MTKGISTSKIARIWETPEGFVVANFENTRLTNIIFSSDADAGEYVRNAGFEEIIWEEQE